MCSKGYCTVTKDASAACTSVVVNMAMTICYIYYWTEHAPIEATDGVSLVKQSRLKFHHAKHHYFTPFSGHGTSKRQNVDSKSAHKMEEQSRFLSRQTGHFCTYIWVETINDRTGTPAFQKWGVPHAFTCSTFTSLFRCHLFIFFFSLRSCF